LIVAKATAVSQLPSDLSAKLDHQVAKYESGRSYLVDHVVKNNSVVTREEWEAFLTPDDGFELTEQDINVLRQYHEEIMEDAAEEAKNDSVIDIDIFRNDKDAVQRFCLDFPRAALLHIHPDGTMKQDTVDHLLNEINPVIDTEKMVEIGNGNLTILYPSEIEYLEGLTSGLRYLDHEFEDQEELAKFFFLPLEPCCHDFSRFESIFSIRSLFLEQSPQNSSYTKEITHQDFLKRNKAYGISYVEFTRPRLPPSLEQLVDYSDDLEKWSSDFDIDLNYNVAFVRVLDTTVLQDFSQQFIQAKSNSTLERVVGIDLLAAETGNSALEKGQDVYVPVWDAWQNGKIQLGGITMHAGEHGDDYGSENVRDAIIMGATRIGHGPLVVEEPLYMEYQRRKKIPMVMNIVSNWQLNVIEDDMFKNHPFLDVVRLGIPLTLSTDDEGMFNTDIVQECVTAIEHSDIQYSELKKISYTAVTASFADDDTKNALLKELDSEFEDFEAQYHETSSTGLALKSTKDLIYLLVFTMAAYSYAFI
jgi:adenosine deaminase